MRNLPLRLSLLSVVALAGCDAQVSQIQASANHIRIGLEHMDEASREADENHEARIFADGRAIVRKNNQLTGLPEQPDTQRYVLRRDANGWTVIDQATHRPVRSSGQAAQGLSLTKARGMLDNLESDADPTGAYASPLLRPQR
jgi:hypothetical protein